MYETLRTVTCCACLYSAFFRAKLRTRYRLPETPAADWAVHCMCEPCALSQEYRELQRRGYDPSIGHLSLVMLICLISAFPLSAVREFDALTQSPTRTK